MNVPAKLGDDITPDTVDDITPDTVDDITPDTVDDITPDTVTLIKPPHMQGQLPKLKRRGISDHSGQGLKCAWHLHHLIVITW